MMAVGLRGPSRASRNRGRAPGPHVAAPGRASPASEWRHTAVLRLVGSTLRIACSFSEETRRPHRLSSETRDLAFPVNADSEVPLGHAGAAPTLKWSASVLAAS
jgi:hypothetical protein